MVAAMLCSSCRPSLLDPDSEPAHCLGMADAPGLPGVLGGFRCSCACRIPWHTPTTHKGGVA